MNHLTKFVCAVLVAAAIVVTGPVFAAVADANLAAGEFRASAHGFLAPGTGAAGVVQRRGMTLSEAVESVRRDGNVERVISAETTVSNGREMHVIKVLTTDGKVRTHRIPGRKRD